MSCCKHPLDVQYYTDECKVIQVFLLNINTSKQQGFGDAMYGTYVQKLSEPKHVELPRAKHPHGVYVIPSYTGKRCHARQYKFILPTTSTEYTNLNRS